MKRYLLLMVALMAFFVILFLIVEALGVPLLSDPTPWMKHRGILAATVAIMSGTSSLRWSTVALASIAGSLPPALLYALTGAAVANFQNTSLMFGVVLLVAGLFWLVGRWFEPYFNARQTDRS